MGILSAPRPWSFTAAAIPVALTAKFEGRLLSADGGKLLAMAIASQAGANLVNSYFDYKRGIDTEEHKGDATIVDGNLSLNGCALMAAGCFLGSAAVALPFLRANPQFCKAFGVGSALGIFYTAPPFNLKYRALGDLVIFASFGPVLTQSVAIALTGKMDPALNLLGLPCALLTEGILWAGNSRDIEADSGAGITTLSMLVGFDGCRKIYDGMVYGAYGVCAWMAATRRSPGLMLPFLTLPLAIQTCSQFKKGKETMQSADERTAQLHLPFGLLMILGLVVDERFFGK